MVFTKNDYSIAVSNLHCFIMQKYLSKPRTVKIGKADKILTVLAFSESAILFWTKLYREELKLKGFF